MKATYVSVWDGGNEVRTSCEYDPQKNLVFNIESTDDVEDLDILDEEYIELSTGDVIKTFKTEDDRNVVDGQVED